MSPCWALRMCKGQSVIGNSGSYQAGISPSAARRYMTEHVEMKFPRQMSRNVEIGGCPGGVQFHGDPAAPACSTRALWKQLEQRGCRSRKSACFWSLSGEI